MRIISQDGRFDAPYEKLSFEICKTSIYTQGDCFGSSNDSNYIRFAEYGTTEKAKKAMEMLHMAYCGICNVEMKREHIEEEVEKFVETMKNAPIQAANGRLGIVECQIFQFPKDEEIEGE